MSFSILLNSTQFITQDQAFGDTTYGVNFTNYEKGSYYMTFSYRGLGNLLDASDLVNVNIDFLGSSSVSYSNGVIGNQSTNYIGTLRNQLAGGAVDNYFYANVTDNTPVYFPSLPASNFIRVRMLNMANQLIVLHDVLDPNVAGYMLCLHFQKI
jgi:hypothetical protein